MHANYKGHIGGMLSMGKGAITNYYRKQRMNTLSSTKTEVNGNSNVLPRMILNKHFVEVQGYATTTVLNQDNKIAQRPAVKG